jgi:hypothetical protein
MNRVKQVVIGLLAGLYLEAELTLYAVQINVVIGGGGL